MTVLFILLHRLSDILGIKGRTIRHVFLYFISFLLVYFSKLIIRFTIISHSLTDEQSRDRTYGGTRGIESLLSAYRYPKATTTAATINCQGSDISYINTSTFPLSCSICGVEMGRMEVSCRWHGQILSFLHLFVDGCRR